MPAGKVVVIGAGSIGQRHFANLQTLGAEGELIPWRSFNAAQFAARRDVAGVVIATQTPIRLELIALCAQNNWPFYAEKPLAWTPDQVAQIYAAAAPVAHRAMVGFMMRYHPVLRALAAMDLSSLYRFHAEIGHDVRKWRQNWSFKGSYAAEPEGGGVLLDLCHEIDLVSALLSPLELGAVRSMGHDDFAGVDFASSVQLRAPNGAAGVVEMDYIAPIFVRKMTLACASQRIEADFNASTITVNRADLTGAPTQETMHYPFVRNDMFLAAMQDFLAMTRGQQLPADPLRPAFDQTRATSDLIAAAWQARTFMGAVAMDMA